MIDNEVRITLRLPQRLRDVLNQEIKITGRSMNAEIIDRLDKSFKKDVSNLTTGDLFSQFEELDDDVTQRLEKVEQKIRELEAKFDTIKDKHGEN